ncbi:MAG TPA: hypothetical protein VFQ84_06570 [Arenimonas sp.]|uniref:hypothetical protein n=1 Tax=Arenimonas sp. TaxID=1872635 RepID=UPI002D803EEE|nr:hypothetical protein [Arenimonas sp.]HEU0152990.1 hypothetical protein [Arenimonas sp.]
MTVEKDMPVKCFVAAMVFCLATSPALAQAPSGVDGAAQAPRCYDIARVVDPTVPAALVAEDIATLRAVAESGSRPAAYLLGTLYRLGPSHPAKRLPQDPEQADRWLRQAAVAGDLNAMAGLAENALAQGRAREGLVLALARAHYAMNHPDPQHRKVLAYGADLVRRGFEALGEPRTEALEAEVLADVQAFVSEWGDGIVAGILASRETKRVSGCPGDIDDARWPLEIRGVSSVLLRSDRAPDAAPHFAMFHLVVRPDGRVARALAVDFSPGPEVIRPLKRSAEGMIFNKLEGAPPRRALLPLTMQ